MSIHLRSAAVRCAVIATFLLLIVLSSSANAADSAGPRTEGDCSPIVVGTSGDVTINVECPSSLSPKELEELRAAIAQLSESSERLTKLPGDLLDRYERLSRRLGVTDQALETFFRILNEGNVPVEELDAKLREIAKRHRELLLRVAELDAVDEKVAALRDKAKAAIERGDYDAAEDALKAAQQAQDKILAQAEKAFLVAAELRARRADLQYTQFRYEAAAELYLEAADLVPGTKARKKAEYLLYAGLAFQNGGRADHALSANRRALAILNAELGADHPVVATALDKVATAYAEQSRYEEAERLFKRALAIREAKLEKDHPDVAQSLDALGVLFQLQGRYMEAARLHKRALTLTEARPGKNRLDVARQLDNLAVVYSVLDRSAEAEQLLKRALKIREARLGTDHPAVGRTLANLGALYSAQSRFEEAEKLLKRALAISETKLGGNHPGVARVLDKLAGVYAAQERPKEAEPLYQRALAILEKALGPDHPDTAYTLNNLGFVYIQQGRYEEAEPKIKRALAIFEQKLGKNHPDVIKPLRDLALLYLIQHRDREAEPLIRRALALAESKLGEDHPTTKKLRTAMKVMQESHLRDDRD